METKLIEVTENKYLISMRKANKKYRENNKEKFREYQKQYYHNHKHDETYMQKQRDKAKKSYHKRKAEKQQQQNIDNEIRQNEN
jgi:hypothetical protein